MKICVYAICKNESKFLDKWLDVVASEADYVAVLDTASTDGTYEKLCNYADNSNYKAKIITDQFDYQKNLGMMRFDKARNDSLKLVPKDTDVCFVIDLDQIPVKGWSDIIKQRFEEGYTEVHGPIVDHDSLGNEINRWKSRNVHPSSPYWIWKRVIHEGIDYFGPDKETDVKPIFDNRFVIDHYPDRSKDRSLYVDLLYYSCKEYPKDPYYGICLGIELSRHAKNEEALIAFMRCLNECDFTDNLDLKYQTYLNIAVCTTDTNEAIYSIKQAFDLGMKTRRAYKILADIYERIGKIDDAINALEDALENVRSYSSDWTDDEKYFNGYIEDRLSLFYYYQKSNPLKAIEYCSKALQIDPTNSRIQNNLKFYYEYYIKSI